MAADDAAGKPEKLFKVIVCGDYAVGKTSLIRRYCEDAFSPNYRLVRVCLRTWDLALLVVRLSHACACGVDVHAQTIGVDFSVKSLPWPDGSVVKLQLWDIAGHERFGCMTHAYYKHSIAAVIVYDVTRQSTFDSVQKWQRDIQDKICLNNGDPIPMVLLANKADTGMIENKDEINTFAELNGFISWFPTSARENVNVSEAFATLASAIMNVAADNAPYEPAAGVITLTGDERADATKQPQSQPQPAKKKCCE